MNFILQNRKVHCPPTCICKHGNLCFYVNPIKQYTNSSCFIKFKFSFEHYLAVSAPQELKLVHFYVFTRWTIFSISYQKRVEIKCEQLF